MFSTRDINGDIRWVGNLNPPLQNSLGENVGFNVKGIADSFGACLSSSRKILLYNGWWPDHYSGGMSIFLEGD